MVWIATKSALKEGDSNWRSAQDGYFRKDAKGA